MQILRHHFTGLRIEQRETRHGLQIKGIFKKNRQEQLLPILIKILEVRIAETQALLLSQTHRNVGMLPGISLAGDIFGGFSKGEQTQQQDARQPQIAPR